MFVFLSLCVKIDHMLLSNDVFESSIGNYNYFNEI